jgi:Fe-S-cluster containining protein
MEHTKIQELSTNNLIVEKQNFSCKKCGKCCMMKLVVNKYDIRKIEKLGKADFYETDLLGRNVLKMNNNKCIFLKKNDSEYYCEVYSAKPKGCADYPFFGTMLMECGAVNNS